MKKNMLFLMILLLIPSVFADITITIDKAEFNLGDKLGASVDIIEENDLEGFFRLSIICDNNNTFEYYATPISLKKNINKKIDIPEVALFEDLLGDCYLDGVLKSQKDYIIDQAPSALFTVSNALNIFLSKSIFTADPGAEINIKGSVKNSYDTNIDEASVILILDNNTTNFTIQKGIIDYNLKIPADIKSYTHFVDIIVEDSYGNKGKEAIDLEINPIPTRIKTTLNKELFIPSETLELEITLLDQADDFMEGMINFEIINPENGKIYFDEIRSEGIAKYTFEQYAVPGKYKLRSFFNDVLTEDFIVMEEYEKLSLILDETTVYVENIGNVKYNKKSTIVLEDEDGNEYVINKRLNLEPGEYTLIDLSKEVPEGNYKIELPEETVEDVAEENIPSEEIHIEDNRNILKKTTQGISKITGNVVGLSDKALMTPTMASVILILIIATLIVLTNRNRIKKIFKKG